MAGVSFYFPADRAPDCLSRFKFGYSLDDESPGHVPNLLSVLASALLGRFRTHSIVCLDPLQTLASNGITYLSVLRHANQKV